MTDLNFNIDLFNQTFGDEAGMEQMDQSNSDTGFGNIQYANGPQRPYFAPLPQVPDTDRPPFTANGRSQAANNEGHIQSIMEEEGFWSWQISTALEDGSVVTGTHRYLFNAFPELRGEILDTFRIIDGSSAQPEPDQQERVTEKESYSDLFDELTEGEEPHLHGGVTSSAFKAIADDESGDSDDASSPLTAGSEEPKTVHRARAAGSTEATKTAAVDAEVTKPAATVFQTPEPTSLTTAPETSEAATSPSPPPTLTDHAPERTNTDQPAVPESGTNAPEYIEDINDPDDARQALVHPDPVDFTKLNIDGDDLDNVKNKMHFYAKQIFDVLLTPGTTELKGRIDKRKDNDQEFIRQVKEKFGSQQETALHKIKPLMRKLQQLKDARANCIIAFEAGIFVHEVGVPKEAYEAFQKNPNRKSSHYPQIDIKSTCSERLQKMVDSVKNHKLVALDVLQGKNLREFALHPVHYAEQKSDYLISNVKRQFTTDEKKSAKKADQKKKTSGKRKHDTEDEMEAEPVAKRTQ